MADKRPGKKSNQTLDDFQVTEVDQSKFWRKFKQDPLVPIGILNFIYLNSI
jgi:hypothetical protein